MKAVRVHQFGGLDALTYEDIPRPTPGPGQVLVHVQAAGVGPWDALIRSGGSKLSQPLPLTLGSDLAGVIESVGPDAAALKPGDEVYGVTTPLFIGAYAEYAVADAAMIAPKPSRLNFVEAASVPVVAVTAWQMLFDHAAVDSTKRVLIHGGGGNVGGYAIQLAKEVGATVVATAYTQDVEYVQSLGADQVIDVSTTRFEETIADMDVVLDTIGGDTQTQSFMVLKPGGILVSVVSPPNPEEAARRGVRGVFFYVNVTSECLTEIGARLETGTLNSSVGDVMPLAQAGLAHEMLAGKPHKRGKIVLKVDTEN